VIINRSMRGFSRYGTTDAGSGGEWSMPTWGQVAQTAESVASGSPGPWASGYVAVSPTGATPNMSWETWCQNKFASDGVNLQKCMSKPFPIGTFSPPWTDIGAIARGIPKPSSFLVNLVGGGTPTPVVSTAVPASQAGLFGVPRTIAIAGALVLVGGLGLASYMKTRRGGRGSRR
jgi:hypothetical protein